MPTNTPREDIKAYIAEALLYKLGASAQANPHAADMVNTTAEALLSQYESSINKQESFWWGVWKGIVSSFISLFLVGFIVIIYVGINTNFWSIAEQVAKSAQQQPIKPN
jgi:uncharacterized membrane protein